MDVRPVIRQVERRAEEVRAPGRRLSGVRRLVIVRHDRLGDLVLTLPAIDALCRTYPDAECGLVVSPAARSVAERVTGISRVCDVPPGARGLGAWLEEFRPDLVVCVSRSLGPAWASWRAGIPHRVGTGHRVWSWLFDRRVHEHRRSGGRHEVEYALSFAHRAGACPGPPRFPIDIEPSAAAAVEAWLAAHRVEGRFVVLVPGSGGSCPRWPVRHHAGLAARLRAAGVAVVVNAGPEDTAVVGEFQAAPQSREVPVFRGGAVELVALVERAALVVGSSTAPIHVAAARGIPALALHAPWSSCGAARWGPYHERGFIIVPEWEAAHSWSARERRRRGAALLGTVAPEVVAGAALDILEGRPPRV